MPLNHAIAGKTGTTRTNQAAVLTLSVCAMAETGEPAEQRRLPLAHRRGGEQNVGQVEDPERAANAAADRGRAGDGGHDAEQQYGAVGRDAATYVRAHPVQCRQGRERERGDDRQRLPPQEGVEVQRERAVVVLAEHDGTDQSQRNATPGRDRGDARKPLGEVHVCPASIR